MEISSISSCDNALCKQRIECLLHEKQSLEIESTNLHTHIQNGINFHNMQILNMSNRIGYLELAIIQKDKEIMELKKENAELRKENAQLKNDVAELKRANVELKNENTQLKIDVAELKKENIELKKENAQLKFDVTELKRDKQLTTIGQFVYEFCELSALYVTQMDTCGVEMIFNRDIYKLNWQCIKNYIVTEGSTDMKARMAQIESIMQEEKIDKCIDTYLFQLRRFRLSYCHPDVWQIPKDRILTMIAENDQLTDKQKNMFARLVAVVHRIHSECPISDIEIL